MDDDRAGPSYLHQPSPKSAASAVDLSGTNVGLTSARLNHPSAPSSPSLEVNIRTTRRRTSWGNRESIDEALGPLGQVPSSATDTNPTRFMAGRLTSSPPPTAPARYIGRRHETDDPFTTPGFYEVRNTYYSSVEAGPSRTSLIHDHGDNDEYDGHREDDEAHLTANMSQMGVTSSRSRSPSQIVSPSSSSDDPENSGAASMMSPRSKRKSGGKRYSVAQSPLKLGESAIKTVSGGLRRMSLRVVNLAGTGMADQLRLKDLDEPMSAKSEEDGPPAIVDLKEVLPLRGRTLGFLGPDSKLRQLLYRFLIHPWTEPMILVLIIANAVVLSIQAFPSLTLPTANGPALPPRVKGYFHTWEDYVLFGLFIVFTVEALARMAVTGFLFDPDVSMFEPFAAPNTNSIAETYTPTPGPIGPGIARQTSLSRGKSITQKFRTMKQTLLRPFALSSSKPPSASPLTATVPPPTARNGMSSSIHPTYPPPPPDDGTLKGRIKHVAHSVHQTIRDPNTPTFLSRAMRSDYQNGDEIKLPFRLSIDHLHDKTTRNVPYLRQSWSRIDFIAIVSFWITFALAMAGLERGEYHIGIFRAMSVIRTARLLTITSGTTTIMHSLKTARPLLTSVALFVLFAIVLFSIIGIQSFGGSLRRSCFFNPTLGEPEVLIDEQFCGGYIDPVTLREVGYVQLDGRRSNTVKGYICPLGQTCKETVNPKDNIESFDAIHYAALQVVIIATANGWTPLMYSMMDAEFFVSCFFFVIGVIVLNFWLINLFVAVITNSFAAIRSATKKSAFGAAPLIQTEKDMDDGWAVVDNRKSASSTNIAKTFYSHTKWCWVLLALASLALQASRKVDMTRQHELILYYGELAITCAFDLEIVLRVLATLPDWRTFFQHANNWLDSFLALVCSIIQIPVIRNSTLYPWFTIFQLVRFYRVILVVPRMKPLLLAVFGNMYGLVNMSLFLMLVNYIAALVAVQLLRGDLGNDANINFGELFNSFLAMYQVFSSENWVDVLYGAGQAQIELGQTAISLFFISAWMLFANFIVLQMFIAVINENFEVAEEAKKGKQATHYWSQQQEKKGTASWFRKLNPYRWIKANPVTVKVENLPSSLVLPMQKTLVQDYNIPKADPKDRAMSNTKSLLKRRFRPKHYSSKSITALEKLFAGDAKQSAEAIPMNTFRSGQGHSQDSNPDPYYEEIERHLELIASVNNEAAYKDNEDDEYQERRAQKADFMRDHPSYDKVFWVISQKNWLRKMCQKVVQPARGERIFGEPYSPVALPIFQLIILLTVVGGIVVESVATPLYRRNYYEEHGFVRGSWFDIAEAAFGFTLFIEFLIKVIADGFLLTPNAYLRSIWNGLDFLIMVGIIVNVVTGLIFIGGLSRITRALKALRALRLITLIDQMRNTFQNLIISGALRIMDAAILALLYMIPYAVWGLNIFAGKLNLCNDGDVDGLADCVNEYTNTVIGDSFPFPVPRVWDNPSPSTTFSFDNFKSSLLILFEIVSFEGWVDAMWVVASITGPNEQPRTNASQWNSIFFVIYNLLGGVVILTLFISIIIGNFSSRTGSAFLTMAQREWIDLQKLFKRQKPSKRPKRRPANGFQAWCFDRAVQKHGWWSRTFTVLIVVHVIALMTQAFSTNKVAEMPRNILFLALMMLFIIDVYVRLYGLRWRSFKANGWNLFDLVAAHGSFVTTILVVAGLRNFVVVQFQKLFLVSIAFKLVQRTNSLNMLFKTAVSSLPVILSLLGLWLILFIFFGILFVEVFGLAKWGDYETRTTNFRSLGSALVMLAFQSTGEGWNQYMHDYALSYPRCTTAPSAQHSSDCGSAAWSFGLFIAWNLLSMYIFVNMFTGVVVENFSYVFQASGSGAKSITREQMRSFKKLWAQYSNPRTGYLERQNFTKFFNKLSGIFEVRIYPAEYSVPNILAFCRDPLGEQAWSPKVVEGVDLSKLERMLDTIDYQEIRKRRTVYARLYHEATISHEPGLGISFTNMLILLAHHKLIVDAEALVLDDLVIRTEVNKLVTDLVNLDRVRSLLRTLTFRRRFLRHLEEKRASKYEQGVLLPPVRLNSIDFRWQKSPPSWLTACRRRHPLRQCTFHHQTPQEALHQVDVSPLKIFPFRWSSNPAVQGCKGAMASGTVKDGHYRCSRMVSAPIVHRWWRRTRMRS
ncbi:high-affinity cell membrane calcium channel, variant 2 [Coprinopsis cinerea AmutBmut pab1-1]|nr:high-affinity cell membrane calcium channel, variant 2 [Coprinopsis cinerea AmutBmut pab1-1]